MNLAKAYDRVRGFVEDGYDVRGGMRRIIAWCKKQAPDADWSRFDDLDYTADSARLAAWLTDVLGKEPPPRDVTAFWFGLFNPVDEAGAATADLYLAGSNRYEPRGDDPDWAVDPVYFPRGRYSRSTVTRAIHRAAYAPGGPGSDAEYTLCLGYAGLSVAALAKAVPRTVLLGGAPRRDLFVGFDDGDALLVATLRAPRPK
jgi:hypothetical protein